MKVNSAILDNVDKAAKSKHINHMITLPGKDLQTKFRVIDHQFCYGAFVVRIFLD